LHSGFDRFRQQRTANPVRAPPSAARTPTGQNHLVADRKAAQGKAPIYMWSMTWETPVGGGIFKTPHTMEIPFMLTATSRYVRSWARGLDLR
jgi:hypothetical protein